MSPKAAGSPARVVGVGPVATGMGRSRRAGRAPGAGASIWARSTGSWRSAGALAALDAADDGTGGRSVTVGTIDGGRDRSASPTRRTTLVDPSVGASGRVGPSDSRWSRSTSAGGDSSGVDARGGVGVATSVEVLTSGTAAAIAVLVVGVGVGVVVVSATAVGRGTRAATGIVRGGSRGSVGFAGSDAESPPDRSATGGAATHSRGGPLIVGCDGLAAGVDVADEGNPGRPGSGSRWAGAAASAVDAGASTGGNHGRNVTASAAGAGVGGAAAGNTKGVSVRLVVCRGALTIPVAEPVGPSGPRACPMVGATKRGVVAGVIVSASRCTGAASSNDDETGSIGVR